MEVRFLLPREVVHARRLEDASAEVCACAIFADERPVRGFAGLLDWRLGGRLSALLKSGFVRGDRGETLLLQGKPHLAFEKVLVVGLGARSGFGDGAFREAIAHIARALEGMRVRRAVVELPGRGTEAIEPEHAMALALECAGASPEHDAWWLVEDAGAQKRMEPLVRGRRGPAARER
jgi:hypothetical protein